MKSYDQKDVTAILNIGLDSQRNIADLNKAASDIIRKREYDEILNSLRELLSVAGEADVSGLVKKEMRLDELEAEFAKYRIELAKEGRLLRELRNTNDIYIRTLSGEIQEAQEYLKSGRIAEGKRAEVRMQEDILKKRIAELQTSRSVAESFSAQIRLSEDNCISMSERIWNVKVTILPLLRGRISMETGKTVIAKAEKMIRENVKKIEEKSVR